MYPLSPAVAPALRAHLDAQAAFINDLSKVLLRSFQQMCALNIELAQTLLEEATLASRQVLAAQRQSDVLGAAAARAQPATDKLRQYQEALARLAAEAQVELARVAGQHVQNTTRSAREVVDEVARQSADEAERTLRMQQEALRPGADNSARAKGASGANGTHGASPGKGQEGGRHAGAQAQPGAGDRH